MQIDILFCEARGIYSRMPDAGELWTAARDARLYTGEGPVVAHPPCQRWSKIGRQRRPEQHGQDGGMFLSALQSVQRCGGVLEHPEGSAAFAAYGLRPPRQGEGWTKSGSGYTIQFWQGWHGHPAAKSTWLYWQSRRGKRPPSFPVMSEPPPTIRSVENMSKLQRIQTPPEVAELLMMLARAAA